MSKTIANPFRTLFAFIVAFIVFMIVLITDSIVSGENAYQYAKHDKCMEAAWEMPLGSAKLYDARDSAIRNC